MRIEEEGSLALDVAGERMHLITGATNGGGTVPCHLLSEGAVAAYVIVLDLNGEFRQAEVLIRGNTDPAAVLKSLQLVEPGIWRRGPGDLTATPSSLHRAAGRRRASRGVGQPAPCPHPNRTRSRQPRRRRPSNRSCGTRAHAEWQS